MPEGLLFVLSDRGSAASEAEYDDWFDNDHMPLRVRISVFQSWSRWVAADGQKPANLALCDLSDADATNQPPFSLLSRTRSDREKDILLRIGVIDRRTYEKVAVPVPPRQGDAYDVRRPGRTWYEEEHVALLSKVPQWVRTTRYVFRDGTAAGTDESLKPKTVPKYLALHECTDPSIVTTEEFKTALSTPWTKKDEQRFFKLHKTWERK